MPASGTNSLEAILQRLDAEMEITTGDGYSGVLRLDYTSVQVTTDGYASKKGIFSTSRTYPNLMEADLSFITKTLEDRGRTLTLADVQWSDSAQTDENGGSTIHYTATAKYTGTTSSKYATGYTISASYTGEVAKMGCDVAIYTATFGSIEAPADFKTPDSNGANTPDTPKAPVNIASLKKPLTTLGLVAVVAVGGIFFSKYIFF